MNQSLLMSCFHHRIVKSEHEHNGESNALLFMVNDDDDDGDEKYYYFAVKRKVELYSSEWLRNKKESITIEDNCFQNALKE